MKQLVTVKLQQLVNNYYVVTSSMNIIWMAIIENFYNCLINYL